MEELRLQKFLAESGIASRRKSEELIEMGKIKVNGVVATKLGIKINPNKDIVEYNGKEVKKTDEKVYILLNKPIGYVTTAKDQFNRQTVMDLLKGVNVRVVPVGRLDMYTSGAILFSNDGEFVNKIAHPRNEIEKTYNVTVVGTVNENDVNKLINGVEIYDDGKKYITKRAKVKILKIDKEKNLSRIQIVIHEGKNREIRKMCEAINKKVLALHRAKIDNIDVKNLQLGMWRYLTEKEVERLKSLNVENKNKGVM